MSGGGKSKKNFKKNSSDLLATLVKHIYKKVLILIKLS